jgi:transketolase
VPKIHEENSGPFAIGKAHLLKDGDDITLVATGETVYHALQAALLLEEKGKHARVLDMHTIKPLDTAAILESAMKTKALVTIEEHSVHGGLGAAVSELLSQNHPVPMKIIGIPDEYAVHGSSPEIFNHYGLTAENISLQALNLLEKELS